MTARRLSGLSLALLTLASAAFTGAQAGHTDRRADPVEWSRTFGTGVADDYGQAIAVTGDGGVIVAGDLAPTPLEGAPRNRDDTLVARFSPAGGLTWKRVLRARQYQYAHGVAALRGGSLAVLVSRSGDPQFKPTDAVLYRLTPSGAVISQSVLRRSFRPLGMVAARDGAIVWGLTGAPAVSLEVMRLSARGGIAWSTSLRGDFGPAWVEAVATRNGGAVIAASEDILSDVRPSTPVQGDLTVIRLAPDGEVEWRRRDRAVDGLVSGVTLADGKVVIAGHHHGEYRDRPSRGDSDVFVARYSMGGASLGVRTYGGDSHDRVDGIAPSGDGVVIAGHTSSTEFEGRTTAGHTYLLVLGDDGQVSRVGMVEPATNAIATRDDALYLTGFTRPRETRVLYDFVVARAW